MTIRHHFGLALAGASTAAVDDATARGRDFNRDRNVVFVVPAGEAIYGRPVMSDGEIIAYREAIIVPMTRSQRLRFEREHRDRIERRARERNVVFFEHDGAIGGRALIPPGNGGSVGLGTSNGGSPRRSFD